MMPVCAKFWRRKETNSFKIFYFLLDPNNSEDDDLSDAESVHDYDHDSVGSSGAIQCDKLPNEILEPLKSLGLVEKLWQRAQPIAENVSQLLKETEKDLLEK